jgi:hypothetical protein
MYGISLLTGSLFRPAGFLRGGYLGAGLCRHLLALSPTAVTNLIAA